jgi:hypothetical protein
MPSGWLGYIMLTPTYSIIYYGNITLDLRLFELHPFLPKHNYGAKQEHSVIRKEQTDNWIYVVVSKS